jgi:GntR family transcriptional regulator
VVEFCIDKASGLPVYLQLARQVREALRLGWLKPGDRLPAVRDVVATSGVNANTVLKAYRELERAGLLEARQGSGTFVKATLGSVDPEVMERVRAKFVDWVDEARTAGLEDEDIDALVGSVLAEGERIEVP